MTDTLIAEVQKNARERIRLELTEYKGHKLVSLRVYADTGGGGPPVPTPKGITCKVTLLPDLVRAMADAERMARAEGLLHAEG